MKPKIRFKGFEGEWKETSLGNISKNFKYGINAAAIPFDGENKYLRITDIDDNTHIFMEDNLKSPGADLSYCDEYIMQDGDIVIARTGASVGKSYVYHTLDGKVYFAGFLIRMRTNKEVISDFVFQKTLTNAYTKHIQFVSQRSGQPGVNVNELKSFGFHIPRDKEEQQIIASYFTSLDSQISASTSRLASLKQTKAASMQAMFPQEGETMPKVRFKGFDGEWKNVVIGEIGQTYSGLSGKVKEDFGIGESRYITFLNVLTNPQIDINKFERVIIKESEHQNKVQKGDLFFNTSSETPEEVGMCSVLEKEVNNVYLNSFCFGFRLNDNNIYPSYIAYLMRSDIGRHTMAILAQGATRYNLSKNNFCKIEIPVPTNIREQQTIADFFTNLDLQISLHAKRLEKLKHIKAACLEKMFV